MDSKALSMIGQKLYGSRWKTPMAKALGYRRETISRWASGKQPVPVAARKTLMLLDNPAHYIRYRERRPNAAGMTKTIGEATIIHADARKVSLNEPVDVILTDPVWPNAIDELVGSHDPFTLLTESLLHLSQYLTPKGRIIIHLRCDSDPRILNAVPNNYPFIRVAWLPYAIPSKQGRVLVSGDTAYIYGAPPKSRTGNHLLAGQPHSDFCPPAQPDKLKTTHPCPRNLTHVEWLIEKFTHPDEVILDPFCGSGTTAVASLIRGRRFIGIEIEKKFIAETERRLHLQSNLLAPYEG